ncbi:MAG TPA: hypothetical protein VNN80_24570 [Polyangiaceae bacterium]|nr:hypothetical protein [Polyangiaceae bacterium]
MGRREPTPESEIHALHRRLALGIGALAGLVLLVRGPVDTSGAPSTDGGAAARSDVSRAELDAAIARLTTWVEQSSRAPSSAFETNQRLLALGRAALDDSAAPIAASLERLAAASAAEAALADDSSASATLAILLEAGAPLERELQLPSGPASLRHLLELALPAARASSSAADPWALDVLSFAVLAGLPEQRETLARRAHNSLLALDHEQRMLASGRRQGADGTSAALDSLQLAASVFRAIAVLADAELEQRGLRQLNALVRRHASDRENWRERRARAQGEGERLALDIEALEALGLLEQSLFGAHLAFRRGERAEPAPRTANSMRRAAGDLLEHLAALERAGALQPGRAPSSPGLLRAATQALRGLRAARIAT